MTKLYAYMSFEKALAKAMRYCAYQERCEMDLMKRFEAWNVEESNWNQLINDLIKEDFLNERRYVEGFIRGKFRMKKWGKNKIIMGLMSKRVYDEGSFDAVFEAEINPDDYKRTLAELVEKKGALIREEDPLIKRDKLYRYVLGKGYESELIVKALSKS